jgi:hypothetical protein
MGIKLRYRVEEDRDRDLRRHSDMRRQISVFPLLVIAVAALWPSSSQSQFVGPDRSLGGYGATAGHSFSSMGGGGAMVIPYGGMTEGFMPTRMGGGASLSFKARPVEMMNPSRTSLSLTTLSGGISASSRGMERGGSSRFSMTSPLSSRGMRSGGSSFLPAAGPGGMGVMPPNIGFPFRQPPSLMSPASGLPGISM